MSNLRGDTVAAASDNKAGAGAPATIDGDQTEFATLLEALIAGALPGEIDDLTKEALQEVAGFMLEAAAQREPDNPTILIRPHGMPPHVRRTWIAIANDDMPFLVDSVSAAISTRGLALERLLHPVLEATRDADGRLRSLSRHGRSEGAAESLIFIEMQRADARTRAALLAELHDTLAQVRLVVRDGPAMRADLRAAAHALADHPPPVPPHILNEAVAFLEWAADDHFLLLGCRDYECVSPQSAFERVEQSGLGLLRDPAFALWPGAAGEETTPAGLARFLAGPEPLVVVKAGLMAKVHRRVGLDYIGVKRFDADGRAVADRRFIGLFTSSALAASPRTIPLLRRKVSHVIDTFGFDPKSHNGKALLQVLEHFQRNEMFMMEPDELVQFALGLLSLTDRPRPKVLLHAHPFVDYLSAFVYVPREAYTGGLRERIGEMLAEALGARLMRYYVELGAEDLARVQYVFMTLPEQPIVVSEAELDSRLVALVRGWDEALEAELLSRAGTTRAGRLALTYGRAFTPVYRTRFTPADAVDDILRLGTLADPGDRSVRLYRRSEDPPDRFRLKIYRLGDIIDLSDVVPALENFGFRVVEEFAYGFASGALGWIHDFLVKPMNPLDLAKEGERLEAAIAAVLTTKAESDRFNALVVSASLDMASVTLVRAWFRYLRQTGFPYGLETVAEALARAPAVTSALIALFTETHDPARGNQVRMDALRDCVTEGLAAVSAIDEDRILRRLLALIDATLRTNAFSPDGQEALAFKLDSAAVPGLPRPLPWREIWIYSPRIEGIHLRGGPIARGGLRWSDRRDDFRTEILGLMKTQVVKNAVIVPTGAKGGFYPKQLPSPSDRDAWLAEGTESYRIFIRALLSVTDNIVGATVVHPAKIVIRDGDDPYFVVAADKGTASFSDIANAIAVEKGFWLGDAFASGGSHGYDHKAMGITAKGAWISVQRHFAEMGIDVQTDTIRVAGCGDMSGDVFGNGMLLSKALKLVAAFDHRHIFLDPDPDPAKSWAERARLFVLPRSSWADYDAKLISKGGGVFPRGQKSIPLSPQICAVLGIEEASLDPSALIAAILKSPVDLLWFGGIGTYVKARHETNAEVGDPANDAHRVDGEELRAKAVGEGANLAVTQAGRIGFARRGGRINTDFIDNSAGVDCSDNEVNIKIALNREMAEGRLAVEARDALLAAMTDDVAGLVLDDNRQQALALSLAERAGAGALPSYVRVIEIMEASGRIDRTAEGLEPNDALLRRAQDDRGLTRPELAVLLSHAKLALQDAIEASELTDDPTTLRPLLHSAFPNAMRERFADAIDHHRLCRQILATKMANRVVNRIGIVAPFEMAEEEGASLAQVAAAYVAADGIFGLEPIWAAIEAAAITEDCRHLLFEAAAAGLRLHIADLLRVSPTTALPGEIVASIGPGIRRLQGAEATPLKSEARVQSDTLRAQLETTGGDPALIGDIVRLSELDGAVGTAALARRTGTDEIAITAAYARLGETLGLDWAKAAALRLDSPDPWERQAAASLARDFEQLRLDFLARASDGDASKIVDTWFAEQAPRIEQFGRLVTRARAAPIATVAMLTQIATQLRNLLAR